MKRQCVGWMAVAWLGLAVSVQAEDRRDLLFIGNSFTGGVPGLVGDLAIDAGWLSPRVVDRSVNGRTLEDHRTNSGTTDLVDAGGWDFVVLQEFSTRPVDEPTATHADPLRFKQDATWFYDRVKANSPDARVVLYETWARHEDHGIYNTLFGGSRTTMQNQINAHYHDAAESYIPNHSAAASKADVFVAPVGEAWQQNYVDGGTRLHADDNYHANLPGKYLNALVLYGSIYQRSTRGLAPIGRVTATQARELQDLADAITGYTAQGGESGNPRANGVHHGSFESPGDLGDGRFNANQIDGWMVRNARTNGVAVRNASDVHFEGTGVSGGIDGDLPGSGEGRQYLWVNSGYAMQYLADTLEANTAYELIVAVGRDRDPSHADVDFAIRLFAGDELLDELTGLTQDIALGSFEDHVLRYRSRETVDPGQRLRIEIGRAGNDHVNGNLAFDNVRLTSVEVPEPTSAAILIATGLALASCRP